MHDLPRIRYWYSTIDGFWGTMRILICRQTKSWLVRERHQTNVLKANAMICVNLIHRLKAVTLQGTSRGSLKEVKGSSVSQYSSSISRGSSRSKLTNGKHKNWESENKCDTLFLGYTTRSTKRCTSKTIKGDKEPECSFPEFLVHGRYAFINSFTVCADILGFAYTNGYK